MGRRAGWPKPPAFAGFRPAPELAFWLHNTFIDKRGVLANPDHEDLVPAVIGCLWTTYENSRQGKTVLGMAQRPRPPQGVGKWERARWEFQMEQWFGEDLPDFVLTFYWPFVKAAPHNTVLALFEHELYHCAQARDEFGGKRFNSQTGLPIWAMRGHDVEEFSGVVRRYGAAATDGVREMVMAATGEPEVELADIAAACGTGRLRLAA